MTLVGSAMPLRSRVPALVLTLLALGAWVAPASAQDVRVEATMETDPVHNPPDAADDPAIWIHPTDPALSVVIGTDKTAAGGLVVYDLAGRELSFTQDGALNNVDVAYDFPLGSRPVSLVAATNRDQRSVDLYRMDVPTRALVKVGSFPVSSAIKKPRGICLYRSPVTGRFYAFVTDEGYTDQYEVTSTPEGAVKGTVVRQWKLQSGPLNTEGLVADNELGVVYLAQENAGGILAYGAEPQDPTTGRWIDRSTTNTPPGNVVPSVKGLSIYYARGHRGYLIAVSQGRDPVTGEGGDFHVYDRRTGAHLGSFRIGSGALTDDVTGMDGIDVTNVALGFAFPQGLFVSQDTSNGGVHAGNQDFKGVPWSSIANAFPAPLTIDTGYDPRRVGAGGDPDPGPSVTPTPEPVATATATPGPAATSPGSATPVPAHAVSGAVASSTPAATTSAAPARFGPRPLVSTGISARRGLRASRRGTVRFTLTNANPFAVRAAVHLETAGGTRLAPDVKLQVADRRRVELHLSARGRRLLRGGTRRVELAVRLRDPLGGARLVRSAFPLHRAR